MSDVQTSGASSEVAFDDAISVLEAAKMTGYASTYINKLIIDGKIVGVKAPWKNGRMYRWVVSKNSIEQYQNEKSSRHARNSRKIGYSKPSTSVLVKVLESLKSNGHTLKYTGNQLIVEPKISQESLLEAVKIFKPELIAICQISPSIVKGEEKELSVDVV